MFLPKHLKNYEIPKDIKRCVLEDGNLEDLFPDVILVSVYSVLVIDSEMPSTA